MHMTRCGLTTITNLRSDMINTFGTADFIVMQLRNVGTLLTAKTFVPKLSTNTLPARSIR